MTKEEAIDLLDNLIGMIEDNHNSDYDTAFKMAIRALEQKTPLDKIKAEIDNINLNEVVLKYENRFYGFQREVIKIIDKYAAEGEK